MRTKKKGILKAFSFSGKPAMIDVFFSMDCLHKIGDYFKQNGDYKVSFGKIAFYMYQETGRAAGKENLQEDDFVSASHEELKVLLNSILEADKHFRDEFERLHVDDIFEHFYKTRDSLVKKVEGAAVSTARPMGQLSVADLADIAEAFRYAEKFRGLGISCPDQAPMLDFPGMKSILAGVPKADLDVNAVIQPLAPQLQADFRTLMQPVFAAIVELMSSIDFSMLTYHHDWTEKHDLLPKFGWFYLNELSTAVVDAISEKKHSIAQNEVNQLVVQDFRRNRSEKLKIMVKKWNSSPYFRARKLVLHQALVNHSRRYYNTSTTMLCIHTEGVIRDFMRLGLQVPRYSTRRAIDYIHGRLPIQQMSSLSYSGWQVYIIILERILAIFVKHFVRANPDSGFYDSRHEVAYGQATEAETEANSLKRFLYMNELYQLFSFLDRRIREKSKH
ncbi:MAG: hypothetical protein HQP61_10295 [Peptococcaceae bacterium]|nr:hypothetical protein [Candidatus Syntrophopropionicum ammoniitolerans]